MKEAVISMIQETAATYQIDRDNISLTGFSMGGAGVWNADIPALVYLSDEIDLINWLITK